MDALTPAALVAYIQGRIDRLGPPIMAATLLLQRMGQPKNDLQRATRDAQVFVIDTYLPVIVNMVKLAGNFGLRDQLVVPAYIDDLMRDVERRVFIS